MRHYYGFSFFINTNIDSYMPRRRRCRCVGFQPNFLYFKPGPEPGGKGKTPDPDAGERIVNVEELESIRLKDYLGLSQEEAAKRMGISQPTFHRTISEAHRKIAEAFVEGKAIRIEGGNYELISAKDEAPVPPPGVPPSWKGRRCGRGKGPLISS
jgi:predicted DNA-binding protein (UPF0251 family)